MRTRVTYGLSCEVNKLGRSLFYLFLFNWNHLSGLNEQKIIFNLERHEINHGINVSGFFLQQTDLQLCAC